MNCLFFSVGEGRVIFMGKQTKDFFRSIDSEEETITSETDSTLVGGCSVFNTCINGTNFAQKKNDEESLEALVFKFFTLAKLVDVNLDNDDLAKKDLFFKNLNLYQILSKLEGTSSGYENKNEKLIEKFVLLGKIEYRIFTNNIGNTDFINNLNKDRGKFESRLFNFFYRKISLNNEHWLDIMLDPNINPPTITEASRSSIIINKKEEMLPQAHSAPQSPSLSPSTFKNKFLSKVAHEFKTPLLCLISLSKEINKILRKKMDEVLNDKIDQMEDLSNYSLFLINDIVHFLSRLNEKEELNIGKQALNMTNVKMTDILTFAYRVLKTLLSSNQNKIEHVKPILEIDDDVENLCFKTDEHRLKQILLNLVSNAVKFTKGGYIKISAKFENEGMKISLTKKQLRISVSDTGVGIRDSDQKKLFIDYSKIDSDRKLNLLGTGLGLSISQEMAKSMGYYIELDSKHGKGSDFSIKIDTNKCVVRENIIQRSVLTKRNQINVHELRRRLSCPVKLNFTQKFPSTPNTEKGFSKLDTGNVVEQLNIENEEVGPSEASFLDSSFSSQGTIQKDFEIDEDLIDVVYDFKRENKCFVPSRSNTSLSEKCVSRHASKVDTIYDLASQRNFSHRPSLTKKKISCQEISNNVIFIQVQSIQSYNFNEINLSCPDNTHSVVKSKSDVKSKFVPSNKFAIDTNENDNVKRSILIIDDNVLMLRSLENLVLKVLKKHGLCMQFNIIRGYDGVDMLKNITEDQKNRTIVCTFIDENLDYLNGSDTIKIIRKMEMDNRIKPCFVCRLSADIENTSNEFKEEEDCLLPKPVTEKEVEDVLMMSGAIFV